MNIEMKIKIFYFSCKTYKNKWFIKSCFVPKRISLVLSGLISNFFVQHQEVISRRFSETFARQESILFNARCTESC